MSGYELALRSLCVELMALPPSPWRPTPPELDPMSPAVNVEAHMDIDGYETSGYYPEIHITLNGRPVATYSDLGDLLRDLDRHRPDAHDTEEGPT